MSKGPIDLRRLPPLKALKGFEAAVRRQSVREAAEELCLTHPAVSHQIQLLESDLGVELFSRDGRSVVPTAAGQLFYRHVRDALDSLIAGAEAVRGSAAKRPLRIQSYVTASIRWLARRLPAFSAAHPDIALLLTTCAASWEFDELNADVGVLYCEAAPDSQFHWQPLFDYRLVPVASPRLVGSGGVSATELARLPLISIYTEARNWDAWFEATGVAYDGSPMIVVDTLAVALEMALAGRGVALMNGPFAGDELAAGTLVKAHPEAVACPGGWGVICRAERYEDRRVRAFVDWLAGSVENDADVEPPAPRVGPARRRA